MSKPLPTVTPTTSELVALGQALWLVLTSGQPATLIFENDVTSERKRYVVTAVVVGDGNRVQDNGRALTDLQHKIAEEAHAALTALPSDEAILTLTDDVTGPDEVLAAMRGVREALQAIQKLVGDSEVPHG